MKELNVNRTVLISVISYSLLNSVFLRYAAGSADVSEDARLDFKGMASKYGRSCEEYDVTTTDGYLLKVFRLRGDSERPVLLMHGFLGTSDDYIIRGNTSLAVALSAAGYDVWLGNYRGNRYSRRHERYIPDENPAFWAFGPHEHACYDLATTLDLVLEKTGRKNLTLIGLSEGTTIAFILTSVKPEYNKKIKVFVGMAPVVFLSHTASPISTLLAWAEVINAQLKLFKQEEVFGFYSLTKALIQQFCTQEPLASRLCLNNLLFLISGFNPSEYEPEFVPVLFGHFPAGSSRQNMLQFTHIANRRTFGQIDYGSARNLVAYGSTTPPSYNLSNVVMETHLLTAKNDRLSRLKDIATLKRKLPRPVHEHPMASPTFSHTDFIWGREGHKIAAQLILNILKSYD